MSRVYCMKWPFRLTVRTVVGSPSGSRIVNRQIYLCEVQFQAQRRGSACVNGLRKHGRAQIPPKSIVGLVATGRAELNMLHH
jgi:hypothetical protein